MKSSTTLIEDSKEILAVAEKIQDESLSTEERQESLNQLSDSYHQWYRDALVIFDSYNQEDLKQQFESEYEGSIWSSKIIKFLTSALDISPFYNPDNPTALISKWTYPFNRCFKEPLLKQCNIIANMNPNKAFSGVMKSDWNETICRIFKVFIAKANEARTNNEKKLTFEYLAIFLVGAIEGLTIIGHDERGVSEEIDLWVSNDYQDSFWQRHIGDPFIVECKNWSDPVGVPEIRSLRTIMRDKDIQFAILLAKNGITGRNGGDAIGLIRKAFIEGQKIVILDESDLLEISDGVHPSDMIKRKLYELYILS